MPPLRTVLDDLPFCLARAAIAFRRLNEQTLGAVGVPGQAPGLATVMHALDELGECTVSALVERTRLPNGTLTGLLDTLEQDGCVRRRRNPDDGRSWILQLTRRGQQLCAKLHERHAMVMRFFADGLSPAEAVQLARLLNKLTAHMRSYASEPAHAGRPRSRAKAAGLALG